MFDLTPAAEKHLESLLDTAAVEADAVLRVRQAGGGWRLRFSREQPDDYAVERNGRTLIVADEKVTEALDGTTLDVRDGDDGTKFVFANRSGRE